MRAWGTGIKTSLIMASLLCFSGFKVAAQEASATTVSPSSATANLSSDLTPRYDVASIRQDLNPHPSWRMNFTSDGVSAKDVTLFYAIEEAYGFYDDELWSAVPSWTMQTRFDVEAKYDMEKYPHVTLEQRNGMLQQLLAERFKLIVHHVSRPE
jgi:hypothetical protein